MHGARLGRIVRRTGGWAMAFAAVFGAVLVAASSARAHGGVSIGIGFGFPAFVGAPIYAPPVYYGEINSNSSNDDNGVPGDSDACIAAADRNNPHKVGCSKPGVEHERHGLVAAPAASPAGMIAVPRLLTLARSWWGRPVRPPDRHRYNQRCFSGLLRIISN